MSVDFEEITKKIQEYAGTQQQTDKLESMVLQIESVCAQACKELEEEQICIQNTII
jgi:hypothetical protein